MARSTRSGFTLVEILVVITLIAVLAGIVLGDIGLYGLGYGASRFQWAQKILERKRVIMVHDWLDQREVLAVLAARFVPGARLPTYTAMGFFKLSFTKFMATVFVASVIWTSLLFAAIYTIGEVFVDQLEAWRWPLAGLMIVIVIIAPRLIQFLYRKEKTS